MKINQGDLIDEFDTDPEDTESEMQSQVSRPSNGKTSSKENEKEKTSSKGNEKEKDKTNYETKSNKGSIKLSLKKFANNLLPIKKQDSVDIRP